MGFSKEDIMKHMNFETVEQVMEFAKSKGIKLDKDEAMKYLSKFSSTELGEKLHLSKFFDKK